jgi:hypothetical protein
MKDVLLNGTMVSKVLILWVQHQLNLHSENFILKFKYKQFKGEIELNGRSGTIEGNPIDVRQRRYWILIVL